MVWIQDMAMTIQILQQTQPTMKDVIGLSNLAQHIQKFLQAIGGGDEDQPRLKQYADMLGQLQNHVKGMAQRLQEQQPQPGQDGNGEAAMTAGKVQAMQITAQAKAENTKESHALKTAQKQAQFELEQQRKDKQLDADIRREQTRTAQELAHEGARTAAELRADTMRTMQELASNAAKQAQEPPTSESE